MNEISESLKRHYGVEIELLSEEKIYFGNDTITGLVCAPHDGNHNRWLLRLSTVAAFDRWANSAAVEKLFETKSELIRFLGNEQNKTIVFETLLQYLSGELNKIHMRIKGHIFALFYFTSDFFLNKSINHKFLRNTNNTERGFYERQSCFKEHRVFVLFSVCISCERRRRITA